MLDPDTSKPQTSNPDLDATQPLPVGTPANPYATQQLNIGKYLEANSTLRLPLMGNPDADQTQKLVRPGADNPPVQVQNVDQPAETAGQTQKLPTQPEASKPAFGWKLPLVLGALVVLGMGAYLAFSRKAAPTAVPSLVSASTPEAVPPAAQAILEQAKAGDVQSMHLLGLMYYNGLNIPRDRAKGLYWLRKAAEKGSDAARAELGQIEGGR
jgi:TPR repeat protein